MVDSTGLRGAPLTNPFRNILKLAAGDFLAKTLYFFSFVYLARMLGVNTFGVLEFANSLLTYLLLLADAGLEIWSTREAAQTSDIRRLIGRVMPLRFLTAGFAFAVLLGMLPLLPPYPYLRTVLVLFGLSLFAQAASLKWVLMGQEKMARVAGGLVLAQLVFAGSVFAFVRDPAHIVWVPVMKFASDAVLAVYFARQFARAHGGLRLPLSFQGAWSTMRPVLTMGATNAMGLLNYNFDAVLLGFLKGPTTVGFYTAAYKPVTVALALPITYFQGMFPALSRMYVESREAFRSLAARSFRLSAIFALPLGVGGTLLAEPVIGLLFGAEYAEAARPLRILIWSAVIVTLRGSYRHPLNAAGKQQLDFRAAVVSSVLNVGLNILLIPKFGMMGAACATVIGDSAWLGMAIFFYQREVGAMNPLPLVARPAIAAAMMGGFLWYAQEIFWVWRAGIAAGIYFAVLLALGEPEVRAWLQRRKVESNPSTKRA
jgi:O-antigen/teichoic acid export membrane protein